MILLVYIHNNQHSVCTSHCATIFYIFYRKAVVSRLISNVKIYVKKYFLSITIVIFGMDTLKINYIADEIAKTDGNK